MNRTDKRVCLLTGASGKLGTAFCRHYARRYHIAAVYRNNFPQVVSQRQWVVNPLNPGALIPENAHPVFAIQADLNDDYQIGRVVELVLARFDRVDVLVNAAVHYSFISMLDTERLFESLERHGTH
jgi:NAD(P)-dependent dehydrogenase (short-subunit alcohol dehydrogenase family)